MLGNDMVPSVPVMDNIQPSSTRPKTSDYAPPQNADISADAPAGCFEGAASLPEPETLPIVPIELDESAAVGQEVPASLVTSWKSFTSITESFKHDENDELVFSSTNYILLDESDGTVYYGSLGIPKLQISLDQARRSLKKIPEEEIYPLLPPELSPLALTAITPDQYIKRPKFLSYSWSAGMQVIAARFLEEARTLDLVRRNPHPNVVSFEGCVVRNGRIVGLAMKRYPVTLAQRRKTEDKKPLDHVACYRGIERGVQHLHSLGIAHNDINPSNVMLDEGDCAVIVDLWACKPFGETLTEAGTPKWNEGFDRTSTVNNDKIGLKKLREWLGVPEDVLETT